MAAPAFTGQYVPPTVTVDSVVFQLDGKHLSVLLIRRSTEPFKGSWALPGGYNAAGETTEQAMGRILQSKAGITSGQVGLLEQLYTFDSVANDPRGHAVSVTYMGLGKDLAPQPGRTTQQPAFFTVTDLPPLAYNHTGIVAYARRRLQAKVTYTNAVFALLPKLFTLTQLQTAYEAILGRPLDKRNFRKKFQALGLIEPTDELQQDGAHRPARLYRFKQQTLQELSRSFD